MCLPSSTTRGFHELPVHEITTFECVQHNEQTTERESPSPLRCSKTYASSKIDHAKSLTDHAKSHEYTTRYIENNTVNIWVNISYSLVGNLRYLYLKLLLILLLSFYYNTILFYWTRSCVSSIYE